MENFEKRILLNYIKKLLLVQNIATSEFEIFITEFDKEFKLPKKDSKQLFDAYSQLSKRNSGESRGKKIYDVRNLLKEIILKQEKKIKPQKSLLETQLNILKDLYNLTNKEIDVLTFLFFKSSSIFSCFFDCCRFSCEPLLYGFLADYLNVKGSDKRNLIDNLYYYDLVDEPHCNADLTDYMQKILNNSKYNTKNKILDKILGKQEKSNLTLTDYAHMSDEAKTAINIVSAAIKNKKKGINILLYGTVGSGKTEFAKLIANSINIPIYSIITNKENFEEANRNDRLVNLSAKQHLLKNALPCCVLFDEAEDVMNTGFSYFDSKKASKGYLTKLLDSNPVPVIWTTNNISSVDPAFLRRMTYTIEFEKLPAASRLNIWNNILKKNKFKIEKDKIEELNKKYDISPSIISNAVSTAKIIEGSADDVEKLIENVASVVYQNKDIKEKHSFQKNEYNINLVNTDLDMIRLTNNIQKSGKLNFSLCLYGEPGTGKSLYARYLADTIGIDVIFKKASDLISMWVGETEQNIAEAFKEAKRKRAMLIIDEADTFLRNRNSAVRSWEVSQVNEMLTWMESHSYPFVCTTNLMDSLDEASLRRFTFKVKFDFMTKEQVKLAMEHFFNIKDSKVEINGLTTGDFATVKKKIDFLGSSDTDEIIQMLRDEVKVKKSSALKNAVGF